ncbi:hypothetical protein SCALM49S_04642 [Streptomyces californicus]
MRSGLSAHPVRYEPMALTPPLAHPLADPETVALAELSGETVYAGAGNERTGSGRTPPCCSRSGAS